eukprot:s830_g20.t1
MTRSSLVFLNLLVAASQVSTEKEIRRQLDEWAAAWQDPESPAAIRSFLHNDVNFGVASTYASWAADLPNVAKNYAVAAAVLESVALLPDCLIELKIRDELQTRCPQKMYKIAIQKLFSMGDTTGADDTWKRARSLFRGSTRAFPEVLPEDEAAIPWPSAVETPTVWVRGLTRQPFWDCHKAWPFVRHLEAQFGRILSEAVLAAPKLQKAYPYLFAAGSWQNLFLYRGHTWNAEICAVMPHTCELLLPEIPTKPGLPYVMPNNEEIVLFRSVGGAYVGPHTGAVNNQINIHLTLKGGTGVYLEVAGEKVELQAGKAVCFQDSYLHSLEHDDESQERLSLVVRVLHPQYEMQSLNDTRATEAEGALHQWSESGALRKELSRLREHYRKMHDHSEDPCRAPKPSESEVKKVQEMFNFLSKPWNSEATESLDAIVVLSNWYDRISKIRKVLDLAAKHRNAPIILVGGRGRLSSIQAAELNGEAHATLAQLLVLMEIPGELGSIITNRVVAISCNECPTEELRMKCGCVGNTGFNTDRFLDWAAKHLPPVARPRRIAVVEESYLVRRVAATVLGRLQGFGRQTVHNRTTMEISVVNARESEDSKALREMMEVHEAMPSAMIHLMADEVVRLENYSTGVGGSPQLFPTEFVAEANKTDEFHRLLSVAKDLSAQYAEPMERVAADRRMFWRCVAPRDLQNPAAWTVPEAPGEAFSYWRTGPERHEPPEPSEQLEQPARPGRVCNEP